MENNIMDQHGDDMKFDHLPDVCVANVLSFVSPQDTCRMSITSSSVRATANSDILWDKYLPPDYQEILTRSASPAPEFNSKKELFLWLCSPVLLDRGKKVFYLDKLTSKKCYVISVRELNIPFASDRLYWCWKPFSKSRFDQVVELVTTWWLEITGSIQTRMLSPDTIYEAYLIFKISNRAYGLDSVPPEASVEVGDYKSGGRVRFSLPEKGREFCKLNGVGGKDMIVPCEREDGWLEIWLGEFKTISSVGDDGYEEEVKMNFREVRGCHLKGGLVVEGIEIRPK